MELITARQGKAHVTPMHAAMCNRGTTGAESCIFNCFENFAATIVTSNEIRIGSGVGMIQGRFFCTEPNTADSVSINNGTQGENRIDLIVARVTVDVAADTQSVELATIQGSPTTGTAEAPEAVSGILDDGDLIVDFPLYQVSLEGITVTGVTAVFSPLGGASSAIPAVGDIEINVSGINPAEKYAGTTWERFAKGKTLIGVDGEDADFSAAKKEGGEKTHTLNETEMPAHEHTVGGETGAWGAHTHIIEGQTSVDGDHVHAYGYVADRAASGSERNTPGSATSALQYNTSSAGGHAHTLSGYAAENGSHSHEITGFAEPTGGGGAHNNLPPYITVYFWLRTA